MSAFTKEVDESAALLKKNLSLVPEKNQGFVASLLAGYDNGKLSPNQQYWLNYYAARVAKIVLGSIPGATTPPPAQSPSLPVFASPEFAKIVTQFKQAKANGLKYPKIKLKLPVYMTGEQVGDNQYAHKTEGAELELTLAGSKSKYFDKVIVTDGKGFGSNQFYGTIDEVGVFASTKSFSAQAPQLRKDILALLQKFGNEPAATAATYGKMTGHCMFCSLPLSDPDSVVWGYGPVCAKKWGLPHGVPSPKKSAPLTSLPKIPSGKITMVVPAQATANKPKHEAHAGGSKHVAAKAQAVAPVNPELPPPPKPKQEFPF